MTSTYAQPASTKIADADIARALQLVAAQIGHPPRTHQYRATRIQLQREAGDRGECLLLPSYNTIHRRYPIWDDALEAVGLTRLGGRRTGDRRRHGGRTPVFTKEICINALLVARDELGDPLTAKQYAQWRKRQLAIDPAAAYELPSYVAIWRRFGSWLDAMRAAVAASGHRNTDDNIN